MTNTKINNFYVNLYKLINSCELTVGTAYFVLRSVFQDVEREYRSAIAEEQYSAVEEEHTMSIPINAETEPLIEEQESYVIEEERING